MGICAEPTVNDVFSDIEIPEDNLLKIVTVGNSGIGKTTMLRKIYENDANGFEEPATTKFNNMFNGSDEFTTHEDKLIHSETWDTTALPEKAETRKAKYPDSDMIIICVATDSKD